MPAVESAPAIDTKSVFVMLDSDIPATTPPTARVSSATDSVLPSDRLPVEASRWYSTTCRVPIEERSLRFLRIAKLVGCATLQLVTCLLERGNQHKPSH